MRRYLTSMATLLTLLAVLAVPGLAAAQEETQAAPEQVDQEEQVEAEAAPYAEPDEGWRERRWQAGGFYGQIMGGTALGLVENVFFRTQFNTGKDSTYGFRAAYVFASRFDVELEYGRSSPGLEAILTDLRGQGKTEVEFADLDMNWFTASVNYSMIERTRRVVPYLTLGLGVVSVSSETEGIAKSRKPGIIFGGGVRVRVVDWLAVRADARGLRSGFGTKQEEEDLPGVFVGDYNASNFLWTVGIDIRF
jgi:hypothetical protein